MNNIIVFLIQASLMIAPILLMILLLVKKAIFLSDLRQNGKKVVEKLNKRYPSFEFKKINNIKKDYIFFLGENKYEDMEYYIIGYDIEGDMMIRKKVYTQHEIHIPELLHSYFKK